MPELPEVEQAARTLGEQIVGAHFDGTIRCSWLKTIESHDTDLLGGQLRDVQVTGWRRRAKWILLTLDNQLTLAAHLRMTGRFVVCGRDEADIPSNGWPLGCVMAARCALSTNANLGAFVFLLRPNSTNSKLPMGMSPLTLH